MIAGTGLFALMACTSLAAESAGTPAAPPAAKGSHRDFTDNEGNQLAVDLDNTGNVVNATAKNKKGEALEVVLIPMKNMSVCIPKSPAGSGGTLCQPLVFLTDGAMFKMGYNSCWCGNLGGFPVCYGKDCH
jgi:hypothetical protein